MADLTGSEERRAPKVQSPETLLFDLRLFKAQLYRRQA